MCIRDRPIFLNNGFTSANLPMVFACRKTGETNAKGQSLKAETSALTKGQTLARIKTNVKGQDPASEPSAFSLQPSALTLETARKLADEGKLKETAEICENHLRQQGPSVQAYYLLGLVFDAKGDPRAADYYRKALYLEPNHYEALWHMALLTKKNGADTEARSFKRRAERAQNQSQRLKAKG